MRFRNKISAFGMYLAVLAGAMTYAVVIVWCFIQFVPLETGHRRIFLGTVYVFIVILAMRFYIPKLRKVW